MNPARVGFDSVKSTRGPRRRASSSALEIGFGDRLEGMRDENTAAIMRESEFRGEPAGFDDRLTVS